MDTVRVARRRREEVDRQQVDAAAGRLPGLPDELLSALVLSLLPGETISMTAINSPWGR
jgi:hypothetical protein